MVACIIKILKFRETFLYKNAHIEWARLFEEKIICLLLDLCQVLIPLKTLF
jgi:hypothetical protein